MDFPLRPQSIAKWTVIDSKRGNFGLKDSSQQGAGNILYYKLNVTQTHFVTNFVVVNYTQLSMAFNFRGLACSKC